VRRLSLPVLFGLIVAAGVFLLGRQLAALYREPTATAAEPARFPPALAGERFGVPADAGFHRIALTGGTLLVEGPHRSAGQARVSLCDQRARSDPASPLIPLYIGWDWTRIREVIAANLASVPPRPAAFGLKTRCWTTAPAAWTRPPSCWTPNRPAHRFWSTPRPRAGCG
jgi:hypothetical protein